MMNEGRLRKPTRLAASFADEPRAQAAAQALGAVLAALGSEIEQLYRHRNGRVEAAELDALSSRYGLRNDCGWEPAPTIEVVETEIFWIIPAGAWLEDAAALLSSLGADGIAAGDDEPEPWRGVPHPVAFLDPDERLERPERGDDEEPRHVLSKDEKSRLH